MVEGIEKVGVIPWQNVKNTFCEECTKESERLNLRKGRNFCWFYKDQWLCLVCLFHSKKK